MLLKLLVHVRPTLNIIHYDPTMPTWQTGTEHLQLTIQQAKNTLNEINLSTHHHTGDNDCKNVQRPPHTSICCWSNEGNLFIQTLTLMQHCDNPKGHAHYCKVDFHASRYLNRSWCSPHMPNKCFNSKVKNALINVFHNFLVVFDNKRRRGSIKSNLNHA